MLVVLERKRSIKQKNEDETWNEPMPFNEKIKLCEVHSQLGSWVEPEVTFLSYFHNSFSSIFSSCGAIFNLT